MSSLTERAKAAKTKDELEAIAKELDGKIVKQRGIETIRADVQVLIDEHEAQAPEPEQQNEEAGAETAAPEAESQPEPKPKPKRKGVKPETRRLKNTRNDRVFIWTPALAAKSGMVEIDPVEEE